MLRRGNFEQLERRSLLSATILGHDDAQVSGNTDQWLATSMVSTSSPSPSASDATLVDGGLATLSEASHPPYFAFEAGTVQVADDGTVLLYSKSHRKIFSWDPVSRDYAGEIAFSDAPDHVAYSAAHHAIYLAYPSGEINKIDLSDPLRAEQPFFRLAGAALTLVAAGEYMFVDDSVASLNHNTLDRYGNVVDREMRPETSYYPVWSEANRTLYTFGYGSLDWGLHSEKITIEGQIGDPLTYVRSWNDSTTRLFRPAPDGSVVLLGNGFVHDGVSLERLPNSLSNSVEHAAWLGNKLFTMRELGYDSQVQRWDSSTFNLLQAKTLPGKPLALVTLPGDRLLAITLGLNGMPQFTFFNDDLLTTGTQGSFRVQETDGSSVVSETGTSDTVQVALTVPPVGNVVIEVQSADFGEVVATPRSLVFTSENWNVPQSVTLIGVDDVQVDGDQRSLVAFKVKASASDAAFHSASERFVRATTLDDDTQLGALVEAGGIAYFFAANHPRVERFDIASGSWLPPIHTDAIGESLTAAHVDEQSLYVAYGTSVFRYDLQGTNRRHVVTTVADIEGLHTDGNILFVNYSWGSTALVHSYNKTTLELIDEFENYGGSIHGSSISTLGNRLFGRTEGISPETFATVAYSDDGHFIRPATYSSIVADTLALPSGSKAYGDMYSWGSRTWTYAGGTRVVDDYGAVYVTVGPHYLTNFPTRVDDFTTLGSDVPLILRNGVVTAYRNTFVPTGSINVSHPAGSIVEIMANGTTLFALYHDATQPSGMQILTFSLAPLNPSQPNAPIDPVGLAFTPNAVALTSDGSVLLFSRLHQSIFRWNTVTQSYVETIPLAHFTDQIAYSSRDNAIYLGERAGEIRKIDLDDPERNQVPFAVLPSALMGMAAVDEYFFVSDYNRSHYLFDASGTLVSSKSNSSYSYEFVWSEANQKIYFIRRSSSPPNMFWEEINENGTAYPGLPPGGIGAKLEYWQWDRSEPTSPLRISPDGTVLILGSGRMYNALTLEPLWPALANTITDAAWIDTSLYTIFKATSTTTHLQAWERLTLLRSREFAGTPISLLSLPEEHLLITTLGGDGVPRFYVTNAAFEAIEPRSQVVGRRLFYDASKFDLAAGIDAQDDAAIASDKAAYIQEAGTAATSYTHVSSYSRGINGLMIDILGPHGELSLEDFSFRIGNSHDSSSWTVAPLPTGFTVRAGAGDDGSDRVEFTWPAGSIVNTWLQVQVAANSDTNLSGAGGVADVFYFGSLVGETGDAPGSRFTITSADTLITRANVGLRLPVTVIGDHNRDGKISAADILLARTYSDIPGLVALGYTPPPVAPENLTALIRFKYFGAMDSRFRDNLAEPGAMALQRTVDAPASTSRQELPAEPYLNSTLDLEALLDLTFVELRPTSLADDVIVDHLSEPDFWDLLV